MIEALKSDSCAIRKTGEASTFRTDCRSLHQEVPAYQRLARKNTGCRIAGPDGRKAVEFQIVPGSIGELRRAPAGRGGAKWRPRHPSKVKRYLPILAAVLTCRFDLVSIVTIQQHLPRPIPPFRVHICQPEGECGEHRRDADPRITARRRAEELSKGWRFFSPYAGLQSSPLLRQLSPHTRDREC